MILSVELIERAGANRCLVVVPPQRVSIVPECCGQHKSGRLLEVLPSRPGQGAVNRTHLLRAMTPALPPPVISGAAHSTTTSFNVQASVASALADDLA
jgi:hypothetical protein